jgi:hypothetical protein
MHNIVLTAIVCKLLHVVLLILCCWMLKAHRLCCFAATLMGDGQFGM